MRYVLIICFVVVLAFTSAFAQEATPPNIVLIVADDLGYSDLGFQGCEDIPTPHLDALARSGIVCTQAYVTNPLGSPSRAGFLTGRYPQRFGHENTPKWDPSDNQLGLPLDQITLADVLKKAGYKTGAVGKWHLGGHPSFHPNRRGFDEFYGVLGGGHHYFDHNQFRTDPVRAKHEYFTPILRNEEPVEVHEYLTNVFAHEAVQFIDRHKEDPFFLYLPLTAAHLPLQAPPKFTARVQEIQDPKRRVYAAMICALDDAVGQVLTKLRQHELERETLVIFFSDNGGPVDLNYCRNGSLRGGKGQLYEGGIRVPFVVSWPGVLKPQKYSEPISTLDLLPTVLAICETTMPNERKLDGKILLGSQRVSGRSNEHRTFYWRLNGGASYAVRHGDYKLVRHAQQNPELYNLKSDPGETTDLAEKSPERVGTLLSLIEEWETGMIAPKWQSPPPPAKKEKK